MTEPQKPGLHKHMTAKIWFYMILIIVLWGMTATIDSVSLRSLSPLQFAMWTSICGCLGASLMAVFSGSYRKLLHRGFSFHLRLFALSMLGFAGYFILKYSAYTMSPIPQANILQYTFTIFIVIFAVPIMKQPLTVIKCVGVAVGFAGAAIVMTGGTPDSFEIAFLPGYFLALAAGVSFALFSVLFDKSGIEKMPALVCLHGYSAAAIFIILLVRGDLAVPTGFRETGGVLYSGFVSNVLGMYMWFTAQNESGDISLLTALLYFTPFFSLLCFAVFLGLPIPLYALAGLGLIVGGMGIQQVRTYFGK